MHLALFANLLFRFPFLLSQDVPKRYLNYHDGFFQRSF
jgi:hypothetical protein